MTHASENLTLPQTSFASGNNKREITTGKNVTGQGEDHKEPFPLLRKQSAKFYRPVS